MLTMGITLPEGPFPASLTHVSLTTPSDSPAIDYSEFLAPWKSLRVPFLHLTSGLSPITLVSMFKDRLPQTCWAAHVGSIVRLSTMDTAYSITLHPRDWHHTWLTELQPHVSGLRHVQLRPTRFVQFINSRLELPDLERITFRMEGPVTRDLFDVEQQLSNGPVRAPKLRILDIHVHHYVMWDNTEDALRWSAECLPRLLCAWIVYDAERLARINLVVPRPMTPSETTSMAKKDFSALASLAEKFSKSYTGEMLPPRTRA